MQVQALEQLTSAPLFAQTTGFKQQFRGGWLWLFKQAVRPVRRCGGNQLAGVVGAGLVQHLLGAAALQNLAFAHHDDVAAKLTGNLDIVGNGQQAVALWRLFDVLTQQSANVVAATGIEPFGGFVGQHNLCSSGGRGGERQPLRHTTGQL